MQSMVVSTVAYLLKARTAEPEKQPLLGNGSANTPVARQWFSNRQVIAERYVQATIEEWLEAVLSLRSVLIYIYGESPETVASLRGRQLGNSNVLCWKTLPSRAVKPVSRTLSLYVTLICKM
jgi:hypothetical protein